MLDALLIAYICKYAFKYRQFRADIRRHEHAGLRHQGKKTYCLQCNGLAARIRARDDERCKIGAEAHINRHYSEARYERMPALDDFYSALGIQLRTDGFHLL